jgi:hypothetical protein
VSRRVRVLLAGAFAAIAALVAFLASRPNVRDRVRTGYAVITGLTDDTTVDPSGAVRSVQAGDVELTTEDLDRIWTPMHLERLARTYWRYLSKATLGLIQVRYLASERAVCLIDKPFVLLRFHAPEYEMNGERGIVRWRIRDGVLVARHGRDIDGYLQIDAERCGEIEPGVSRLHVEVEVANFYPRLASSVANWFYKITQSRIHVFVTHGFLRSLARLDLAESKVGRFARQDQAVTAPTIDEVPDPPPSGHPTATQARAREVA